MSRNILPAALAVLCACASTYVYNPEENATATIRGRTAAYYQIPPAAPRGDVRIASFGIAEIVPPGASAGEVARAIHLRLVVANNSDQPWSVDTREQRIAIPGQGESVPAYGTADANGPLVEIPPSGKRRIDLFFPLPRGMQHAGKIPSFDALWEVALRDGVVKERTTFERLQIEPTQDDYVAPGGGYYGWGQPFGWYNPMFPGLSFPDAYALPAPYLGGGVMIGAPAWRWPHRDGDGDRR